ncbi:MAG: DUF5320 domain-containing protein [Spirochaetales bacterium]|nr:DUF5320 domain-containing protein [Spirochaetales bacterium]
MPRGDGTGPNALGPMTGRAAGFCAGNSVPGFANPIIGRGGFGGGFGRFGGGGRGRGFRNRYYATGSVGFGEGGYYPNVPNFSQAFTPGQEAEALKNQAKYMQENLNALNERIKELEKFEAGKEKPQK